GRSRWLLALQGHAPRKQLLRFRISPEVSWSAIGLCAVFVGLALGAFRSGVWVSSVAAAFLAAWVAARTWADTGFSGGILREWIRRFGATESVAPTGDPSEEIESASEPSRRTENREEGIEGRPLFRGGSTRGSEGRPVASLLTKSPAQVHDRS